MEIANYSKARKITLKTGAVIAIITLIVIYPMELSTALHHRLQWCIYRPWNCGLIAALWLYRASFLQIPVVYVSECLQSINLHFGICESQNEIYQWGGRRFNIVGALPFGLYGTTEIDSSIAYNPTIGDLGTYVSYGQKIIFGPQKIPGNFISYRS
jgi:hypothetical protein